MCDFKIPVHDIVRYTDPDLVRLARGFTNEFNLPSFQRAVTEEETARFVSGRGALTPAEREALITPYAILGQTIRVLVKNLVKISTSSAAQMATQTRSRRPVDLNPEMGAESDFAGTQEAPGGSRIRQILTPAHVSRALGESSPRVAHLRACLGRLGVGVGGLALPNMQPRVSTQAFTTVKVEDTSS